MPPCNTVFHQVDNQVCAKAKAVIPVEERLDVRRGQGPCKVAFCYKQQFPDFLLFL